jgi:LysR family hydrogen peroxide-inducible transcriptional activator
MNIQDLRYVVTVAKLRHFGRAAKACHISQPTLSNQIRKLEEELGVVIFERSNKRVDLTEIGEQMVLSAQRAIDEVSELERLATVSRDPLDGPLRLGTIPTLAPYLMPHVWRPLQKQYPKLKLTLWEDATLPLLEKVRDRVLDAALVATEVDEADLTGLVLFEEPCSRLFIPTTLWPNRSRFEKKILPMIYLFSLMDTAFRTRH